MSKASRKGEYEVYDVTGQHVQLRVRRRVPWGKIISLLLEGHEVFIPCDRRTAYYIRKRVEREIGELIEAYPSSYRGMEGYTFKVSLVEQYLRIKGREVHPSTSQNT